MTAYKLVLLFLTATIFYTDGKRLCLSDCYFSAPLGSIVRISEDRCSKVIQNACETIITIDYHNANYTVSFGTSYVDWHSHFLYILSSNYLSYTVKYSCSKKDSCALEFVQEEVLRLYNKTYDAKAIGLEIGEYIEEIRPASQLLVCHDDIQCSDGVCQIEYNTQSQAIRKKECNRESYTQKHVSVYDGITYSSFNILCNGTRCNSPQTYQKVKEILWKYNLTDADGRISDGKRNNATLILIFAYSIFLMLKSIGSQ